MITGTFQGWNIIALPTKPGFSDVRFEFNDSVGVVTSPYTMQQQIQQWPGADLITGECSLPPMSNSQAPAWIGFLAECAGQANCFLVGDQSHVMQGKPGNSQPLVVGGVTATKTLSTSGWDPNRSRLMLPGDYFQIGMRLHIVLDSVTADANGNATLNIWPSLRDIPATGTPLILYKPQGLFRLAGNQRGYSSSVKSLFGVEFKITEAR